jgi:hypothetical protein
VPSLANQPPVEESSLERTLDILEKIYFVRKALTDVLLIDNF